jgi:serine phosphatase RsbU (regulator of sigma subunit)
MNWFEKEKKSNELNVANQALIFQLKERDKRAAELIIANKELIFQNKEKEDRAAELKLANIELLFQNKEKENRANELIIANKELHFQHEEKIKRAEELIIANKELDYQNKEKEKRATELIIANIQKVEAERSKLVIEEKNKNITDSIKYAKRIQLAKLPKKEEIYSTLKECFVLFKPKDIVSGDFYFYHKNQNSIFVVAADCTGHGVPGAFMSMIGSEKLDDAIAHSKNTSEILKHLNQGIKSSLHQSDNSDSTKDGMDIALCSIDIEKRIVNYSGANRPLWLIRKGNLEIEEFKPTKKAIGGYTDNDQHFENHEIQLQKGDTIYIATDGYADQFGGNHGKKLMTKVFKDILLKIQHKPMNEQEKHLESFIEIWKEGIEQVDDILVIGVRL